MAKDHQPDNRKARKKKNIGKLPPVPEAQNTEKNTKGYPEGDNYS